MTAKRLLRLVAYRERLEGLQEAVLARAVQRQAERRAALAASASARATLIATEVPEGTLDPFAFHIAGIYLRALDRQVEARQSALAHSDLEVQQERERLLERRRNRKAMDSLLQRRLAEAREERNRGAIAQLDEQARVRWLRSR